MRVCLINPILFSFQRVRSRTMKNNVGMSFFPPLGLCYIANMLERYDFNVKIIDRNALMTKHSANCFIVDEITKNEIKCFKPDIVGITSTTATFFDVKNNLLNLIRSIDKNIKIVLGGPHASALPEEILSKCSDIDIICRGEGEIALLDIAKGTALKDIQGLSYRDGSGICSNRDRDPYLAIDDLCFPSRHLVDMSFYCRGNPYVMHGLYARATTVFTSRGCAFDCTFCAGKVAVGKKVRFQSPDLVIEEIEKLIKDYRVEGIYFADDMFDINKQRADIICEKLIEKGLHKKMRWYPQLRANSIEKRRVELMKRAGAVRADIGFESGSQRTLNTINKRTTVEQNYNAARILHEAGLQFQANIIVGIPGETEDDIRATEAMVRAIKPHWIGFGEFIPLPGSRLYQDLLNKGVLTPESVESLVPQNYTEMDDCTMEKYIKHIRNKIVIPTRIKSYLIYNWRKPGAYAYMLRLVGKMLLDYGKSLIKKGGESSAQGDDGGQLPERHNV